MSVPDLAFPTGVGVIRRLDSDSWPFWRVPHRRGGDPQILLVITWHEQRSPQAWG